MVPRKLLPERNVVVYYTEFDEFKEELERRHWDEELTSFADGSIDVAIVKEFYANLYDPEDKSPKQVRVRGHLIKFDEDTLNIFLKTPVIVEEEGAEVSGIAGVVGAFDLLPLAFLGPLNVTVGSSRFQQFFLMYAKLMAGLRLSRDLESNWTPLALHRAVIKAGNPSLEESCCAVIEIWWEMRYPTFISIFMMMP